MFSDPSNFPNLGDDEDPQHAAPVLTEETKSLRSAYRKTSGESFNLVCEALAEPDPEVAWFKDQIPIISGGPYLVEKPSNGRSVLTIDQLTKMDSGLYTCMARNNIGSSARNFTLDVVGDESSNEVQSPDLPIDFPGHSDLMPTGPQNTTVEQGDKAVLECKVQSLAIPKIKWLKKLESREYDQVFKKIMVYHRFLQLLVFYEVRNDYEIQLLAKHHCSNRNKLSGCCPA